MNQNDSKILKIESAAELNEENEEISHLLENLKLMMDDLKLDSNLQSSNYRGQTKGTPPKNSSIPNKPTLDKLKSDKPMRGKHMSGFPDPGKNRDSSVLAREAQLAEIPVPIIRANEKMDKNTSMLMLEFSWLRAVLNARIVSYFEDLHVKMSDFTLPVIDKKSRYGAYIHKHKLNPQQRLILCIALTSEICPDFFDVLQSKNTLYDLPFAEFGGMVNLNHVGFSPTIQTALYVLAGSDLQEYLEAKILFGMDEQLLEEEMIESPELKDDQSQMHGQLKLTSSCREQILLGHESTPKFSADFPARELNTHLEWEDLVLMKDTEEHLQELTLWLKHSKELIHDWTTGSEEMGYKVLFYGPPGTGKTLTANLLAKKLNRLIFRIDLSQIVSKFIGETEKNLEKIFKRAEKKDWILFFDEADSLFSKRSSVSNSNDRHANQETAYLLQRIETCQNLVILASNLKDNLDEAFSRRFQSIINFPKPDAEQREKLWNKGFSAKADVSKIDIAALAKKYELSGAEINNVIRFSSLKAIDKGNAIIEQDDIVTAIRREIFKEGKFL